MGKVDGSGRKYLSSGRHGLDNGRQRRFDYQQAEGTKGHEGGLGEGGTWDRGEGKMTQKDFWKKKQSTKQAHFTTWPSTDVCLQNWVPWKVPLGFQGKQPWRYGFLSCGLSPRNLIERMWAQVDSSFLYTWKSFGMGKDFLKDWKKKIPEEQLRLLVNGTDERFDGDENCGKMKFLKCWVALVREQGFIIW